MAWWRKGKRSTEWGSKLWAAFGEVEAAAAKQERERIIASKPENVILPRVRIIGQSVGSTRIDPGDQIADLYDPDAIGRSFYKPAQEVARYSYARVKLGNNGYIDPPVPHRLQLVECVREGGRLKPRLKEHYVRNGRDLFDLSQTNLFKASRFFETTGDWRPSGIDSKDYNSYVGRFRESAVDLYRETAKQYREARAERRGNLRETQDTFGQGYDGQDALTYNTMGIMDTEFIPLGGGPYYRQLYLYAHWEQTAKAFEMKNHSELARAAIEINSDFTLGRGVGWKIKHPEAAAIWEEFWARNNMANRLRVLSDDLTWCGELLVRKFQPLRGFLSIRSMDPSSFYEIITDPQDVESVLFYYASYPTPWQLPYSDFRGHNMNIPFSQYVVQQYPANEIHHIKNNVSATEKWGRSDFYAALGIMKRHRDWSNAATLKDMLQANFIWKIKVQGDGGDVQSFLQNQDNLVLPPFGSTWVENEALNLEPIHEDVASGSRGSSSSTGSFLTAAFATSQQMPISYFNVIGGGGAARATALVQSEPFVKKIETRQQMIRGLLDHLYEVVMQSAIEGGRIGSHVFRSAAADPEWVFPTLYEEDRQAKMGALTTARAEKAISHRTESIQLAQEIGLAEYDYDREMIEIRREQGNPILNPPQIVAPDGQPMTQPSIAQQDKGFHERLDGADARARFKQSQREGLPMLSPVDQRFLEAAIRAGNHGSMIRLPSGLTVSVSNYSRNSDATTSPPHST